VNRVTLGPGRERGLVFVRGESAIRARVSASPGIQYRGKAQGSLAVAGASKQTAAAQERDSPLTFHSLLLPSRAIKQWRMQSRDSTKAQSATTPTQSTDKQRSSSPETGRKMATNSRPARVNRFGRSPPLYEHASPKGNSTATFACHTNGKRSSQPGSPGAPG
jgi:hypothetical protein